MAARLQAEISALTLIASDYVPIFHISSSTGPMRCQCTSSPQADMLVLKLITSGGRHGVCISCHNGNMCCHCQPFSQAEMAALKLTTSRDSPWPAYVIEQWHTLFLRWLH
eukprot:12413361-Karenia_brevis.AAC.2